MRVRIVRLQCLAVACLTLGGLLYPGVQQPVSAYSVIDQHTGFDLCAAPAQTTMDSWWTNSTLVNVGIYIGGANRSCAQPNLTASWVAHEHATGWGMIPLWVGPQLPNPECTNQHVWNTNISLNTSTAYTQGWNEGTAAYAAAGALGMDRAGMPITYDLEGYKNGTGSLTTCRNAAKAFMHGWADYLAAGVSQLSGVYGSANISYIDDFASDGNPPDFIFFAYWDGQLSTSDSGGYISSSHWTNNQRHKQYAGPHYDTHGGIQLHIDSDCSNGPVYYNTYRQYPYSPCQ
jgi:Domain of unknown function (DUF1906)